MPNTTRPVRVFLLIGVLSVLGAVAFRPLLFTPTEHLKRIDFQQRFPIEQPFHVLISCGRHEQYGEAAYGDDAPVFALFAGCKPQGNFYLVADPSTPEEACETRNEPEVTFQLMESGEVKNASLTRGSGNSSVDRKILQMVQQRHYPPTKCGTCVVFSRIPVSRSCRGALP